MKTIHQSTRTLLGLGLTRSESAAPQTITRTAKFKINTDLRPALIPLLNRHFDAFDAFRAKVMEDLESWWNRDPVSFEKMVHCGAREPYQDKTSCFAWLYRRYLTGMDLPADLSTKAAFALLDSLAGGLKSFLTRRKNVTAEIKQKHDANLKDWTGPLQEIARDQSEPLPAAPPPLDFANLTAAAIEGYNRWVGLTRAWCNLKLIQKHKLDRAEACLPRYLKGYPGFPGSRRYAPISQLVSNLSALEAAARRQSEQASARFASLSADEWAAIGERFSPPPAQPDDCQKRPATVNQTFCRRFGVLQQSHPDWPPVQHAQELLAGTFRAAAKLQQHLIANGYSDRRAVIKLASLYNVAAVFALEPVRVSGDYIAYYDADTPRRDAFGAVRGALHEPTDESSAIQITGFSLKDDGTPNYNGALVTRRNAQQRDEWAFLYCHLKDQTFQIASADAQPRGKRLTEWTGFGSRGGSRKKAEASAKELVRGPVWVSGKVVPTELPLSFGARQGRDYLWHFDRDLRTKNEWVLGNGRLLRIVPPGLAGETEAGRQKRHCRAEFYLTITLERQAPPLAQVDASHFIGVDRGEKVPVAYALIDAEGRLLKTGKVAEEYREQQQQFNDQKRELQRQQGGYNRWLRSKERNRARALGGEVTRALLALSAEHQAPLVLENLNSSLATRGGKGTMMSQMQYERVLTSLEQKLAEAGLYAVPSAPKFRKSDNGFLKLVGPAYTSATCSACGHVHSTDFYEKLANSLTHTADGRWQATLSNGETRLLPLEYTYWAKGKGEQTKATAERLAELLNGKPLAKLSATNRKALVALLKRRWLPFRPEQAQFQCVLCGHAMNADEQAALNIARKFLFARQRGQPTKEATEAARGKVMGEWQAWYQEKAGTVWKKA